jgi:hypothetical protein
MINERQKKTTQAYRDSEFWNWVDRQKKTSVDLEAKERRKKQALLRGQECPCGCGALDGAH